MANKLWIFGDSYADPKYNDPLSWPYLIKENFDVTNKAKIGTGIDWSLQTFYWLTHYAYEHNIDTSNINVLFFMSGLSRNNLKFYDPPSDQVWDFDTSWTGDKEYNQHMLKKYKQEKKYYNWFLKNWFFHSSYIQTENLKVLSYLQQWSKKFNKILVLNNFEEFDFMDMEIWPESTKKFHAESKPLAKVFGHVDGYATDERANHMDAEHHPIFAKQLVDHFIYDKKINLSSFKKNI